MSKGFYISLTIGVLLILLIIFHIGIEKVVDSFKGIDFFLLFLSTLFLLAMHFVMAVRVKYLGKILGVEISLKESFNAHMLGMFLSEITPGRSGYFGASAYLRKKGIESSKALAMLMSAQPFDFFSKVMGALVGFMLFLEVGIELIVVLTIASLGLIFIVFSRRFVKAIERVLSRTLFTFPIFGELLKKAFNYLKAMNHTSKKLIPKLPVILCFIVVSYTLRVLNWYFLFLALGGNYLGFVYDFFLFYVLQPLINIVEFIPLPTPAGSGLSEIASVIVLTKFGFEEGKALAFGILARVQSLILSSIGIVSLNEAGVYIKKRFFN